MNRKDNTIYRVTLALFICAFSYRQLTSPGALSSALINYPWVRLFEKYFGVGLLVLPFSFKRTKLRYLGVFFGSLLAFEAIFNFIQLSPLTNILAPFTASMRVVFPLIIVTGLRYQKILITACAFTFLGHGLEALFGVGKFIDYFIYTSGLLGFDGLINETLASILLKIIGSFDIFFAGVIFTKYKSKALRFMIFWGLTTSVMRVLYYDFGVVGFFEFFFRIPHWIIPLLLLAYKNEQ